MLGLLAPTDPSWAEAAEADLDGLLSDHAHCELKAAQSALSLVARFGGELPDAIEPLGALAREESSHFLEVERRLRTRGANLRKPGRDRYVLSLREAAKHNLHDGYPHLLDRLLTGALIEGRSCERFRLLADRLRDASLRAFYRGLMASEAKHFTLFSGLASKAFGEQDTRTRFAALAQREGVIAAQLPLGPTVHG